MRYTIRQYTQCLIVVFAHAASLLQALPGGVVKTTKSRLTLYDTCFTLSSADCRRDGQAARRMFTIGSQPNLFAGQSTSAANRYRLRVVQHDGEPKSNEYHTEILLVGTNSRGCFERGFVVFSYNICSLLSVVPELVNQALSSRMMDLFFVRSSFCVCVCRLVLVSCVIYRWRGHDCDATYIPGLSLLRISREVSFKT